jgi:branched-chain amino acid transport system substrate-binding protein
VLGLSGAFNGSNGYVGNYAQQGLTLGMAQLNARGGVYGHKLTLRMASDNCDPGTAPSAAKKLISDNVTVIFGPNCSGATLVEMPLAKAAKTPLLESESTNAKITAESGVGGNPYTWRINASDSVIAKYCSTFIASKKTKSVSVIAENDEYGRGAAQFYSTDLPANGVKVLGTQYETPGQADYDPILSKIQAENAQAIVFVGEAEDLATLIEQMHAAGLAIPLYTRGALETEIFGELGKNVDLANGVFGCDYSFYGTDPSFDALYLKNYHTVAPEPSVSYYNLLQVMVQAMTLAGGVTSADVEAGLRKIDVKYSWGIAKFDSHNQAQSNVYITVAKNGVIHLLKEYLAA